MLLTLATVDENRVVLSRTMLGEVDIKAVRYQIRHRLFVRLTCNYVQAR